MNHPFLNHYKSLLTYISVWLLMISSYTFLLLYYQLLPFPEALLEAFIAMSVFAMLILPFWYQIRFTAQRDHIPFTIIGVSAVIFILIWNVITTSINLFVFTQDEVYATFYNNSILVKMVFCGFLYAIFILFYILYKFFEEDKEKKEYEISLLELHKETRLLLLNYQLQPHFLFNSLNSIYALIDLDPEKGKLMLLKISEFLRKTLDVSSEKSIPLDQELNFIRNYLDIEKIRFNDRLQTEYFIQTNIEEIKIPPMLLQPLIENCIKHGLNKSENRSIIEIKLEKEASFIVISVSNNYQNEEPFEENIGLANVRKRLFYTYGYKNLLEIKKEKGIFTVQIKIPFGQSRNE